VISTSFADIFRSNALKNGLLPVAVEPGFHLLLVGLLK
jgi:3-isopropylmalate dehydratase small subunit